MMKKLETVKEVTQISNGRNKYFSFLGLMPQGLRDSKVHVAVPKEKKGIFYMVYIQFIDHLCQCQFGDTCN